MVAFAVFAAFAVFTVLADLGLMLKLSGTLAQDTAKIDASRLKLSPTNSRSQTLREIHFLSEIQRLEELTRNGDL